MSTLKERWYSNEVGTEEFFSELLYSDNSDLLAIANDYYFNDGDAEELAYRAFALI